MLQDIFQVKMRRGKTQKNKDSALQQRVECMVAINSKLHRIPFHTYKVKVVSAITSKYIEMKDLRNTV